MIKANLYFDTKDNEYFNKLKEYIAINYQSYFKLTDNRSELKNGYIISDYLNKRNNRNMILIKDTGGDICKYTKASEICAFLLERCSRDFKSVVLAGNNATRIICVTSALGGAGKSIVAKALCCKLSQKGKKVLYINADPFSTGEHPLGESEKNLYTELRYFIRKNKNDIGLITKSLAIKDELTRVDYIVNGLPSHDGFMEINEAERFAAKMQGNSDYQFITIDLPSHLNAGHLALMKFSSSNIVVLKHPICKRQDNFLRFLKLKDVENISKVDNFSETGEIHLPRTENIFKDYPDKFWDGIECLYDSLEVNL